MFDLHYISQNFPLIILESSISVLFRYFWEKKNLILFLNLLFFFWGFITFHFIKLHFFCSATFGVGKFEPLTWWSKVYVNVMLTFSFFGNKCYPHFDLSNYTSNLHKCYHLNLKFEKCCNFVPFDEFENSLKKYIFFLKEDNSINPISYKM